MKISFRHVLLSLSLGSLSTAKVPLQTATVECTSPELNDTLTVKMPMRTGVSVVVPSVSSMVRRSLPPIITGFPEDMDMPDYWMVASSITVECTISALDTALTFEVPITSGVPAVNSRLPSLVQRSLLPPTTASPDDTDDDSETDSDDDADTTTSTSMILSPQTDKDGPGINNIPLKPIKGQGKDGKKITYPNKTGSKDCSKKCSYPTKFESAVSCLTGLQEKIHKIASKNPGKTYRPLERIACAPNESMFCAFVEAVPWTPSGQKDRDMMAEMDTQPYRDMEYNYVPIGAIVEGIDWIEQNGAKMCGQSLLPVQVSSEMIEDYPEMRGHVYILKADVNSTLAPLNSTRSSTSSVASS